MNFLLIEVQGRFLRFRGGELEGRSFSCGEVVSVRGDQIRFNFCAEIPNGSWLLHSTFHRGHPAVACSFFNKRTNCVEERYYKVFRSDGLYMCGPRYPRSLCENRPKKLRRRRRPELSPFDSKKAA